jgi:hypothetical protein
MYQVHGVRLPRRRRKPRRGPDQTEAYRACIRQQPSCVSESRRNIEACHTGPHGLGQKSSGYTCIPLTHQEHMELHQIGPRQFQEKYRIDFEVIIEGLFTEWSEIQARRFGKDVPSVEPKPLETAMLDAAEATESGGQPG